MRIGYCSIRDPYDKKSLSGLDFHMVTSLNRLSCDVIPLIPSNTLRRKIFNRIISSFIDLTKIDINKSSHFLRAKYRNDFSTEISKYRPDLLFVPNGAQIIPSIKHFDIPIVYFSDATFKVMDGYYENFNNLSKITKKWFSELENISIKRADALIYPSHWAANSAINDYSCSEEKIYVIPCGGNLENQLIPELDQIFNLSRELQPTLNILFIGGNWERKGGDIVVNTFMELNKRGIDTHLTICGDGPESLKGQRKVDFVGRLDQNNPEEMKRFHRLYLEASILFVPSRQECFGFVFPEASAFGLPIVSTRTGGIPDYVEHNRNGYLMTTESTYAEFADIIEKIWKNKELYRSFSKESRIKYDEHLNWEKWSTSVYSVFSRLLN